MRSENSKEKIKKILAEHIGVEPDDIDDEDSLVHDLHMSPVDLSDFAEILQQKGFRVMADDMAEIETFEDLVDFASAHEEIK